jgi:hypothetical protein
MDMCIHTVRPTEWAVEDFAAQIAARSAAALVATKCGDDRAAVEAAVAAQVVAHVHWILVQTPDQRRRGCRNGVAPAQEWCGEMVHGVRLAAPEHWTNLRLIQKEVSRRNIGLHRRSTAINPNGPALTFDHRHTGCPLTFSSAHSLQNWGVSMFGINARDFITKDMVKTDWNPTKRGAQPSKGNDLSAETAHLHRVTGGVTKASPAAAPPSSQAPVISASMADSRTAAERDTACCFPPLLTSIEGAERVQYWTNRRRFLEHLRKSSKRQRTANMGWNSCRG